MEESARAAGRTSPGRPGEAQRASGSSRSRGAPSGQAQRSAAEEPDASREPAPPKPREEDEEPDEPRRPVNEEESGATAGRGSSRGSSRNPAVSEWTSRDQVTAPEDEDLEDDRDTEDEEEEQESRGGVQPHLRDRKPPVSRDLRISFGNNPNPDANGRGGPSEQKKSRGVASLVLGVPIPDRIKGQPNPGRTKITQERIEPRAEEATPVAAGDRGARAASAGTVPRPDLAPWMRALVRAYFLGLRSEGRPAGARPAGES